jgi:hypothetical protein
MDIKSKSGMWKKAQRAENIERIKEWFTNNPDGLQRECADALSLSIVTVNKCVQIIRKG